MKTLLNIREAAERCRVRIETLRNWEAKGKIIPLRTPGKHRRYTEEMLEKVLNSKQTKGE